jgi:exopolysaccharide biosynthesis polyprenyl glycosylphosphotransferase
MTTTPRLRACLEGSALFVAVSATLLWRAPHALSSGTAVLGVLGQAGVLALCYVVASYQAGLYDLRAVQRLGQFLARLPLTIGLALILLVGCYTLLPPAKMPADAFQAGALTIAVTMLPLWALGRGVLRSPLLSERVLILGSGPLVPALFDAIRDQREAPVTVLGAVEERPGVGEYPGRCPVLGSVDHLPDIVDATRPDRIIVALTERRGCLPVRQLLASRTHGVAIEDGVDAYERLTDKLAIEVLTPSTLVFAPGFRRHRLGVALERGLTVLLSAGALVGLAPLLGLIALAIKLDSKGPVFFVQERLGQFGRPFGLIKFRTMHPTAHGASEWVRDNGHRITRVGGWLRRFRLDELPQFVNALRGEMNLVGPRPHPVSNGRLFLQRIPYYSLRSMVPPGITGWAQVRYGYANGLEEETEKMRYDLYYIKHMSLWLDLRILVATGRAMLVGPENRRPEAEPAWPAHPARPAPELRKAA